MICHRTHSESPASSANVCVFAVQGNTVHMDIVPAPVQGFAAVLVQNGPHEELAARILDALAYGVGHRGRNLGIALPLRETDMQDVALVIDGHERLALGGKHSPSVRTLPLPFPVGVKTALFSLFSGGRNGYFPVPSLTSVGPPAARRFGFPMANLPCSPVLNQITLASRNPR